MLDIVQAKKKVSDPNLLLKELFELAKETVVVQEKDKMEGEGRTVAGEGEMVEEEGEEKGSLIEDIEMARRLIFATLNFHCKRLDCGFQPRKVSQKTSFMLPAIFLRMNVENFDQDKFCAYTVELFSLRLVDE